jgi:hypothetical protein
MRKALGCNREPRGPPPQHPPPRMGRARPSTVYGGMGAVVQNDMTLVIPTMTSIHTSTAMGATTTMPPNLSLRESGSTPAHPQWYKGTCARMATTRISS